MHIPDGILPLPVTGTGYAATAATAWYSIHRIRQKEDYRQDIPKASLLTAAFFVASWIHIPIPPTSVHLVLNGLLGALLGYYAFPAILIGLFFQAVMFGHGGLTTLGINAVIMGLLSLFTVAIFVNLLRDTPIGCGCFHTLDEQMDWTTLVRDLIWIGMAAHVHFFDSAFHLEKQFLIRLKDI